MKKNNSITYLRRLELIPNTFVEPSPNIRSDSAKGKKTRLYKFKKMRIWFTKIYILRTLTAKHFWLNIFNAFFSYLVSSRNVPLILSKISWKRSSINIYKKTEIKINQLIKKPLQIKFLIWTYFPKRCKQRIRIIAQRFAQRFDQFQRMFQTDGLSNFVFGRSSGFFSIQMRTQRHQMIDVQHARN